MGVEKTAGRSESRAAKVASRCDGTAEGTDILLRALIQDRLNGAVGGKVTRDCCRVIQQRVSVARNSDVLNDLYARSKEREIEIDEDLESEALARAEAEALALEEQARQIRAQIRGSNGATHAVPAAHK